MAVLVPFVAYAEVGGDLIVLDTHRGDYDCVFRWRSQPDAPTCPSDLIRRAYVSEPLSSEGVPPPTNDLEDVLAPPVSGHHLAAFTREAAAFYASYPFRSFRSLLLEAAARSPSLRRDPCDVTAVALIGRRLMPWALRGGQCFYRSLLMLKILRRLDLDADLVLGVKTWPFEAHCWLQLGGVVLDDRVDRARIFTPMLVL